MGQNNISNAFMTGVDTIVENRIGQAKFDETILCTIVQRDENNSSNYLVEYQNAKFYASAANQNNRYSSGQQVYVNIPLGNYHSPNKQITGLYNPTKSQEQNGYRPAFSRILPYQTYDVDFKKDIQIKTGGSWQSTTTITSYSQSETAKQYRIRPKKVLSTIGAFGHIPYLGVEMGLENIQDTLLVGKDIRIELFLYATNNGSLHFTLTEDDFNGNRTSFISNIKNQFLFNIPRTITRNGITMDMWDIDSIDIQLAVYKPDPDKNTGLRVTSLKFITGYDNTSEIFENDNIGVEVISPRFRKFYEADTISSFTLEAAYYCASDKTIYNQHNPYYDTENNNIYATYMNWCNYDVVAGVGYDETLGVGWKPAQSGNSFLHTFTVTQAERDLHYIYRQLVIYMRNSSFPYDRLRVLGTSEPLTFSRLTKETAAKGDAVSGNNITLSLEATNNPQNLPYNIYHISSTNNEPNNYPIITWHYLEPNKRLPVFPEDITTPMYFRTVWKVPKNSSIFDDIYINLQDFINKQTAVSDVVFQELQEFDGVWSPVNITNHGAWTVSNDQEYYTVTAKWGRIIQERKYKQNENGEWVIDIDRQVRDRTQYTELAIPFKGSGITFNEINKTVYCELYSNQIVEGSAATIQADNITYYRSDNGNISFDIGVGKNQGSAYSLNIIPMDANHAVMRSDTDETNPLRFKAILNTPNGETIDSEVRPTAFSWDWYQQGTTDEDGVTPYELVEELDDEDQPTGVVQVFQSSDAERIDIYAILRVSCSQITTKGNNGNYIVPSIRLVNYYAIPYAAGPSSLPIGTYQGPTRIVYNQTGVDPIINWDKHCDYIPSEEQLKHYGFLKKVDPNDWTWNIKSNNYMYGNVSIDPNAPQFTVESELINGKEKIINRLITPTPYYITNTLYTDKEGRKKKVNLKSCVLVRGQTNTANPAEVYLYVQPLLIIQDTYSANNVLEMVYKDYKDTPDIMALRPTIAAGTLNSSNQFTGVFIGDLRQAGERAYSSGIYGLSDGALTFSVNDKGEAWFAGELRAPYGEIGGWVIDENQLSSTTVDGRTGIELCGINSQGGYWISAYKDGTLGFHLGKDGKLEAWGATITGHIEAYTGNFSDEVTYGSGTIKLRIISETDGIKLVMSNNEKAYLKFYNNGNIELQNWKQVDSRTRLVMKNGVGYLEGSWKQPQWTT